MIWNVLNRYFLTEVVELVVNSEHRKGADQSKKHRGFSKKLKSVCFKFNYAQHELAIALSKLVQYQKFYIWLT